MSFGKLKQNFRIGAWVRIGSTASDELDGTIGRIVGLYHPDPICDCYIILLPKPLERGDLAIVLIETCIEPYEYARQKE